jgi:hypothetical protein
VVVDEVVPAPLGEDIVLLGAVVGAVVVGAGMVGAVFMSPAAPLGAGAGLTVIGLEEVEPVPMVVDGAALGAGVGVATIGALALAFTPLSLALELAAGRTRGAGERLATAAAWCVGAATASCAWVVVVVVCCVVVVAAAGAEAAVASAGGSWAAVGGAAVFSAVWLVAVEPGVSWVMPLSCGWLAYQATPPIAARATTPAATAPRPTPPRPAGAERVVVV